MAAIRGKNTTPERIVRSVLHRLGCRFALHRPDLPGKPDIVMPAREVVVLVHGCYWHMHRCKRGRSTPATNATFWRKKRRANKMRDRRTLAALRRCGWVVLVVWECQTKGAKLDVLERRLQRFLGESAPHSVGRGGVKQAKANSKARPDRMRPHPRIRKHIRRT
jgi:DNA mismatch endonuclease (patch repair protein)